MGKPERLCPKPKTAGGQSREIPGDQHGISGELQPAIIESLSHQRAFPQQQNVAARGSGEAT